MKKQSKFDADLVFGGFDPSALKFFKSLKRNNNREWFLKRKESYEELLKKPLASLIVELGKELGREMPEINFNPKRIFRVNRDLRFSEDKSPYKTNIGVVCGFHNRPQTVESSPGLYIHLEPDQCFVGGGLYMPNSVQIRKIRNAIDRDPDSLSKIIDSPKFKKYFKKGLGGEKLKRAPAGFSPEHPNINLLNLKHIIVSREFIDREIETKRFLSEVAESFRALVPLLRWLNHTLSRG